MASKTKKTVTKKFTPAEIAAEIKLNNRRTRERNRRFEKMSDAQKRVRIAKDVIEHIKAGFLKPANSGYLTLSRAVEKEFTKDLYRGDYSTLEEDKAPAKPLHQLFQKSESCTVCGIGGVFVAAVVRADKCTVDDMGSVDNDDYMREYLGAWFDIDQLGLIESAFEYDPSFGQRYEMSNNDDTCHAAAGFGYAFKNPSQRLLAIMENIVENDGQFVVDVN